MNKQYKGIVVFLEFYEFMPPRHALFKRSLKNMGFDIKFIYWNRDRTNHKNNEETFTVCLPAKKAKKSLIFVLPALWHRQWQFIKQVNPEFIFVGHFFLLPLALFWMFRTGWRSKKVIYDALEQFPINLAGYFGLFRDIVYPFFLILENVFTYLCSGVLTVDSKDSSFERRLKRYNRLTLPIWNVPSKSDDPEITAINALNGRYSLKHVVVFAGALRKQNGLLIAIDAASIIKDHHKNILFLFIGTMMEDPQKIEKLIDARDLKGHVKFINHIPYTDMLSHFKHAKIGLALYQPDSLYHKLSLGNARKIFSYMQAGIPVIGPDSLYIGKIINLANCGLLIDSTDARIVARAIQYLLDNEQESRQLGINGRIAFENFYNWEKESIKFSQFFEKIVQLKKEKK